MKRCILKYLPILLLMGSCVKKERGDEGVLLRYGDQELTYEEVIMQIPGGLSPSDSASLFSAIVEGWAKDIVLSDFAEERLVDLNSINQRVRDYRNSLIVLEYLSRMRETQNPVIEEARIKEYYDKHRKELKLEVPLVRGIFMKINSESKGKERIKGFLGSDNTESIDKLEQEWLDRALEYNYFQDKWIDWETISGKIPYRFGDPDNFLKENNYFETEYGDCTYYLKITDYMPSGEEQPYEFASGWIKGLLTQGDLLDYEKKLVASLLSKSIKDKKLEPIGYDPLNHELKENIIIDEKK